MPSGLSFIIVSSSQPVCNGQPLSVNYNRFNSCRLCFSALPFIRLSRPSCLSFSSRTIHEILNLKMRKFENPRVFTHTTFYIKKYILDKSPLKRQALYVEYMCKRCNFLTTLEVTNTRNFPQIPNLDDVKILQ